MHQYSIVSGIFVQTAVHSVQMALASFQTHLHIAGRNIDCTVIFT